MATLKIECNGIDLASAEKKDMYSSKIVMHLDGVDIDVLMQEVIRDHGCKALLDCIGDDEIRAYLGGCDE